ncbi:uncharacterized protein LOC129275017 isoform X2 [Lytechinus pictus]|uniref:uncharacterized protein LOC129275017 isoform X2 n=1 Tax=Lytechinus pictus TaxID=7653 RepID=UPI0030BA2A30
MEDTDGRIYGYENNEEYLDQVEGVLKKQEEIKGQLSKTERRLDGLAESTGIGSAEPSNARSKLVRDLSFHIYEVVDRRNSQRQPKIVEGGPYGEEDLGSLIKKLVAEHQDVETRLQALEGRVDRMEKEYQSLRDEADAAGQGNNPHGLRMGLSISLSSLNSISEAVDEEGETESIKGSDSESATESGKGKSNHVFGFRRKKKDRRSSDSSVDGNESNEGFHERMSLKMAHVSAKLGKIARVSRSVKVPSNKEEDKDDKKYTPSRENSWNSGGDGVVKNPAVSRNNWAHRLPSDSTPQSYDVPQTGPTGSQKSLLGSERGGSTPHSPTTAVPPQDDHNVPRGWRMEQTITRDPVFINEVTAEKWYKAVPTDGEPYYYSEDRSQTRWDLPAVSIYFSFS